VGVGVGQLQLMWDDAGLGELMLLFWGGGGDTLLLVYIHVLLLLESFGLFRRLGLLIERNSNICKSWGYM